MKPLRLVLTLLALAVPVGASVAAQQVGSDELYITTLREGFERLERGELESARSAYEKALDLRPFNSIVAFHLACIEARRGRRAAGVAWLAKALEWGYRDAEMLRSEPDLAALRDEPGFDRIVSRMAGLGVPPLPRREIELGLIYSGWQVALSPDGRRIALGQGQRGNLVDADSGRILAVLGAGAEFVDKVCFTPDGATVLVSVRHSERRDEHRLLVYDAWSGRLLRELSTRQSYTAFQFSRDGRRMLSTNHAPGLGSTVWDVATWTPLANYSLGSAQGAALHPNGDLVVLASAERTQMFVHGVTPPERLAAVSGVGNALVAEACWLAGDRLVVADRQQGLVTVVDARIGVALKSWRASEDELAGCWASADGQRAITVGGAGTVKVWSIETAKCERTIDALDGQWIVPVLSPDREILLAFGYIDGCRAIELSTGTTLWELGRGTEFVRYYQAAFDAASERVAMRSDAGLTIRDARTGVPLRTLAPAAIRPVSCSRVGDGAQISVADARGRLHLLDTRSGLVVGDNRPTVDRALALAAEVGAEGVGGASLSPGGSRLLTWLPGGAMPRLWNVADRALVGELLGQVVHPDCMAWSDDGTLLATTDGHSEVGVWITADARLVAIALPELPGGVLELAFDAQGTRVAVGSGDAKAHLIDLRSGAELRTLSHADQDVFGDLFVGGITWRSDGERVITTTCDMGSVAAWNPRTGARLWTIEYGGGNPSKLVARYSRDERRVLVHGQTERTVRVVDAADGRTLLDLADQGLVSIEETADASRIVGLRADALAVYDGSSGRPLWLRTETEPSGGRTSPVETERHVNGELRWTPDGWCHGTRDAFENVVIVRGGTSYALASHAALLFDPKRLQAAARGVRLAPPELPEPPAIRLAAVPEGILHVSAASFTIVVLAADPSGIRAIESCIGARTAALECPADASERPSDEIQAGLGFASPEPGRSVPVEIRALARSGLTSRTIRLEVVRDP